MMGEKLSRAQRREIERLIHTLTEEALEIERRVQRLRRQLSSDGLEPSHDQR